MEAERALEFDTIRQAVREFCITEPGRRMIEHAPILTTREALEAVQSLVVPIHALLSEQIEPPSGEVPALETVWDEAAMAGSVLELEELAAIRALLVCAEEMRRFLRHERAAGALDRPAELLQVPVELRKSLARHLLPTGALNEAAIPEIARLRGQIGRLNQDVLKTAQSIIRSNREMFRADAPTVRDGRTVVADRKSTRLNSSHNGQTQKSRMPSSA